MGWSCIGTGAVVEGTTSLTLAEPAGSMDGDLQVACFSLRAATTFPVGNPTGWTTVAGQANNNVVSNATTSVGSATMLYRVRSGAGTLTFAMPANTSLAYGRIMTYRGNTATPLDVTAGATTATNVTAVSVAGLTTTAADDLIVAIIGSGRNATGASFAATTPSGASGATVASGAVGTTWVERADSGSNTTPRGALLIYDALKSTAGATGNFTATMSVAGGHAVVAGAFKVAPVTGVNVFSGSAGVEKPVKVWSGTAWVAKQTKFWTGTTWKNVGVGRAWSGVPGTYSPEAEQFFARVSGLTDTRKVIYDTYIKALVSAGVWAKLHWHYKTNAPTTDIAVTNLKSSSYKGTIAGTPIYAIDGGMGGRVNGTTPDYINTGYNPSTQGSQNDAHISVTVLTDAAGSAGALMGVASSTAYTHIYPKYTNGVLYGRINDAPGGSTGPTNTDASGFIVATRSGGSAQKLYDGGTDTAMTSVASGAQTNGNMYLLAQNDLAGGAVNGSTWIVTAASAGSNLTQAEVTAFKNAQATFDAAVVADRPTNFYPDTYMAMGAGGTNVFTYATVPFPVAGTFLFSATFPGEAQPITATVAGVSATVISDQVADRYSTIFRCAVSAPGVHAVVITTAVTMNYCAMSGVMLHNGAAAQTDLKSNVIVSTDINSAFQSVTVPTGGMGFAFLNRIGTKQSQMANLTWAGCDTAVSDIAGAISEASNLPGTAINHKTGAGTFNPTVSGAGTFSYTWNYTVAWAP